MKLKPTSNFMLLPNPLVERAIKKLKPSEFLLFLALYYLSYRFSTDHFHYTDAEITKRFGISGSSLTRARVELKRYGLIDYVSGFRTTKYGVATQYYILPSNKLRKLFRIPKNQNDKPP